VTVRIRRLLVVGLVMGMLTMLAPAAMADPGARNCWGVVTSQRAQVDGADFGAHSSSFDGPRMGLGNTANALGFDSVAELGAFLASVDGIDATSC
jgi:hypothetical protein